MKKIKYLVLGALLVILTGTVIIVIFSYDWDSDDKEKSAVVSYTQKQNTLRSRTTDDQFEKCMKTMEESIVGIWEFPGGDIPAIPYIKFDLKGEFILSDKLNEKDTVQGKWSFLKDRGSIQLQFVSPDQYWEGILSDQQLTERYPSVASYSLANHTIEFFIGYFPNPTVGFNGECEKSRFFINMFNVKLYRQV